MYKSTDVYLPISDLMDTENGGGIETTKKEFLKMKQMRKSMENKDVRELLQNAMDEYSGWHFEGKDSMARSELGMNTIDRLDKIDAKVLVIIGEFDIKDYLEIAD